MKKYLDAYLKNKPLFYSFIRPKELKMFHDQMPFRRPILDFGCGDGFYAKVLFEKNKIDVGIDNNKEILSNALKSEIYKKVIIYDGKRLPFKSEYFSTVVSNCVLEHVFDVDYSLKEIFRVLKKKGIFIVTVATINWENYLFFGRIFGDFYKRLFRKVQRHNSLLSEKKWCEVFENAGFKILKKEGYISKRETEIIEMSHYFSVIKEVIDKVFGESKITKIINKYLYKLITKICSSKNTNSSEDACYFYILQK